MRADPYIPVLRRLDLWRGKKIAVTRLKGGMTNHNYLVADGKKKYVARFAPETTAHLHLNRKWEMYNCGVAARRRIGPNVVAFYPRHRLLVVEYLEGEVLNPKLARKPRMIAGIGRLFRTLHSGPKFKNEYSPFTRGRDYVKTAQGLRTWVPPHMGEHLKHLALVEAKLGKLPRTYPCHLDVMISNLIATPGGQVKLIDWEYSSNADYRYDLAMLSIKAKFKAAEDRALVRAYAGRSDAKLYTDIQLMKAAVYFAEAAYGVLQNALSDKTDVDYKRYALVNMRSFERVARSIVRDAR